MRVWLERREAWLLGLLLLTLAVKSGEICLTRPFWFDELLTYHVSRLESMERILQALAAVADGQPPLSYFLTRGSQAIFGATEWGTRFPEWLAFLLMSFGVYALARPRAGVLLAATAMLFVWQTHAFDFSVDARPYALMMAASAGALLAWRSSSEGRARGRSLTLLALCLGMGVASHYYAALIFLPVAAGELARVWARKAIDWGVVGALAVATLPLVASLPVIRAVKEVYSGAFWFPFDANDYWGTYVFFLGWAIVSLLCVYALLIAACWRRVPPPPQATEGSGWMPASEWIAFTTLALLPIIGVTLALLISKGYVYRYVAPFVIGAAILLAVGARRLIGSRREFEPAIFLVMLAGFALLKVAPGTALFPTADQSYAIGGNAIEAMLAEPDLPVAVPSFAAFLPQKHYGPKVVSSRLVYLADPKSARDILGADTPEWNLILLDRWVPLDVEPYDEFIQSHPKFLILHRPAELRVWLLDRLRQDGLTISTLADFGDTKILLAENK